MMADFNGDGVVLCNTYQCYLKDTLHNVKEDLEVHLIYTPCRGSRRRLLGSPLLLRHFSWVQSLQIEFR